MPGDTTRSPLNSWARPLVRAAVLAYRATAAQGHRASDPHKAAMAAFIAAGGDPAEAGRVVPEIIAAAARDHGEWFWRPVRERVETEERYWRRRGIWPPPKNPADWPTDLGD